ncbi:FMN phosphatase YigB, HAD superfamily [Haloarcula vallismortis]|uniref:Haloacid dehalogenase domain-containing protein hydrolase n=2 Tax=Haloarcula vallismortis TaxID=28442 RepID=M0JT27_HALVA|nr:HAD family hydrolase [Haloarcula vallismortis]EMA11503.1 Haloacid dehalogenase domain-containing protein hydrolase [Haloarcula vallismortis ATCC 29715]SDW43164.1 FMN phosphatase YigB, HAD superfamily [Haloarcula vallismortis]
MALSFDLFGTLVGADRPEEPWDAVAAALAARSVRVPDDWEDAYRSAHRDYERGREAPLDEHVRLALASRGVEVTEATAAEAVLDAFDSPVTVRDGAIEALDVAARQGPVAVCSNCSVPGLVERTLERAGIESQSGHSFDAVITSVGCGWRKPHPNIFETTADTLDVPLVDLVHVGDDARTDGGAGRVGAQSILLEDHSLPAIAEKLREGELC